MLLSDGCESCSECHLLIAYHLRRVLLEQVLLPLALLVPLEQVPLEQVLLLVVLEQEQAQLLLEQ
jgi:hypothetical protein